MKYKFLHLIWLTVIFFQELEANKVHLKTNPDLDSPCSGFLIHNASKSPIIGQTEGAISCGCSPFAGHTITWLDANCHEIKNDDYVTTSNQSLIVSKLNKKTAIFYCTNKFNCTYEVFVSRQVVMRSFFIAIRGCIILVDLVCIYIIASFVYKKLKHRLSRQKNNSSDPREMDYADENEHHIGILQKKTEEDFFQVPLVEYIDEKKR